MKVQLHRHGFQGFLEGQVDIVTIASTVYSIIEKVHINSSFQLSLEIFEFYAQVQGQIKVSAMFSRHKKELKQRKVLLRAGNQGFRLPLHESRHCFTTWLKFPTFDWAGQLQRYTAILERFSSLQRWNESEFFLFQLLVKEKSSEKTITRSA